MAIDLRTGSEPGVTTLVSGIINDAQDLIKQQLALLKHEIKDDIRKTREGAISLSLGLVAGLIAGFLLSLMIVHLLSWAWPSLPLWACYAIVGGAVAAAAMVLLYSAKKQFQAFMPFPEQSVQGLKENVKWITNPK